MQGYIVATGLDRALRDHRWADFARGYNGKNYAVNAYDTKLHDAFQHYTLNGVPDIGLRAAQLKLTYEGCNPGPVDGLPGMRTRQATERFQQREGLRVTGDLDPRTLSRLGVG
jgi:peptidoglycan hydrolase-like protein with peptidoglycan-binding domain